MSDKILWTKNPMQTKAPVAALALAGRKEAEEARAFHRSFPQYTETPLVSLQHLADRLGVRGIYVKDESKRFGLNAFKVLGGSYAMGRYIADRLGYDLADLPYWRLGSREIRDQLGEVTFFTATDGNHGRGVAWAANQLGQKSVVYMPAGSSLYRLERIRDEGAEASIQDMNYDEAVRLVAQRAEQTPNGVMVQDTAWDGYEEIPGWIMQGYGTMALEADAQIRAAGDVPTHIFVQAGVGSLAGTIQAYFADVYGERCPVTTVMEPHVANCHYESAVAGGYRTVGGEMQTIMAGLACGEPNTISWDILKNWTDCFVSCPDWVAARGMRMAAAPLTGDEPIVSGESGAVGLGLLSAILQGGDIELDALRGELGLDENSVVLLFSTEGDTDPQTYTDIVWDGDYCSKEGCKCYGLSEN
ncbi:MAG: diaminopropionate ammonia-lyase [Oscillospiraceae bacterium]|nr:diaminopropionate ammonia-lyase [Oscillospiraceae bacterium]